MDAALNYPQNAPDFNVAVAISLVLIGFDGKELQILVARAQKPPFQGGMFLPSRYINSAEDATVAAQQMFHQMFSNHGAEVLEQLQAFAGVHRHPDGRVVNIAHYALVRKELFNQHRYQTRDLKWFPYRELPDLVFDHNDIVSYARERLKRRIKRRPVGFNLLPESFTLQQLQTLYEQALNKSFDRRNFRKKLANTNVLIDLEKVADGTFPGQRKGAGLFSFNQAQYELMMKKGYDFLF